jgi:methyl-accepting chemotaxis protein
MTAVNAALEEISLKQFAQLRGAIAGLAEGDLTVAYDARATQLPATGSDEIADLTVTYNRLVSASVEISESLGTATSRLRELVGRVASASDELVLVSSHVSSASEQARAAAEEISTAIVTVAGGARSQSERISQATAAIEELARAAQQVAAGAGDQAVAVESALVSVRAMDAEVSKLVSEGSQLAASAASANAEAVSGREAVGSTMGAMLKLQGEAQRANDAMVELEGRSVAVAEIVDTIQEIADQTNLLALNAAIEAARASEHGRGFAVVADEVRKLAERAANATRQITAILTAIRAETIAASTAMRDSAASMSSGISLAERATVALSSVGDAIADTSAFAQGLATHAGVMESASGTLTSHMSSVCGRRRTERVGGRRDAADDRFRLGDDRSDREQRRGPVGGRGERIDLDERARRRRRTAEGDRDIVARSGRRAAHADRRVSTCDAEARAGPFCPHPHRGFVEARPSFGSLLSDHRLRGLIGVCAPSTLRRC